MKHGSLFSGIGGFDLASEWMGWENVFHCEWNEFGKRVLKYYWPNAISYDDITKTDFTIHQGSIDILTGGFPCQPFSMAGKRKGTEDERYLWPEMLRAIREIQPRFVVGENVSGIVNWDGGMVFQQVQTDLEAEGYEVIPFILPAVGRDAPHRRRRIWFIAHSINNRYNSGRTEISKENGISGIGGQTLGSGEPDGTGISFRITSNPQNSECQSTMRTRTGGQGLADGDSQCDVSDTCDQGLQGGKVAGSLGRVGEKPNEQLAGCVQPNWNQFPTQPPVRCGNDGISTELVGITVSKHRNESIKGYGNAIVPQVVYQIFKAIEQFDLL